MLSHSNHAIYRMLSEESNVCDTNVLKVGRICKVVWSPTFIVGLCICNRWLGYEIFVIYFGLIRWHL